MIDTLAYVRQVTQGGVPREQAKAIAEALKTAPQDEILRKRSKAATARSSGAIAALV